jgi:hypothetical protein
MIETEFNDELLMKGAVILWGANVILLGGVGGVQPLVDITW